MHCPKFDIYFFYSSDNWNGYLCYAMAFHSKMNRKGEFTLICIMEMVLCDYYSLKCPLHCLQRRRSQGCLRSLLPRHYGIMAGVQIKGLSDDGSIRKSSEFGNVYCLTISYSNALQKVIMTILSFYWKEHVLLFWWCHITDEVEDINNRGQSGPPCIISMNSGLKKTWHIALNKKSSTLEMLHRYW